MIIVFIHVIVYNRNTFIVINQYYFLQSYNNYYILPNNDITIILSSSIIQTHFSHHSRTDTNSLLFIQCNTIQIIMYLSSKRVRKRNSGVSPSPSSPSNVGAQTGPSIVPGPSIAGAIAGSSPTTVDVSAPVGVAAAVGHAGPVVGTSWAPRDVTVVRGAATFVVHVDATCGAPWTTVYVPVYGGLSGDGMVVGYFGYTLTRCI